MLALVWHDKKDVKMLSSYHTFQMQDMDRLDDSGLPRQKPSVIFDYNRGKVGVDISDQLASGHKGARKFVRWYKKLFLYLIDKAIVNSFFVHKVLGGKHKNLLKFKMHLIRDILTSVNLPGQLRDVGRNHVPAMIPGSENKPEGKMYRWCAYCAKQGLRSETRYV